MSASGRIAASAGSNLLGQHAQERNQDNTCYVGNLDPQVTEELIWELFTQAGPVVNVFLPKDRVTSAHQGFGFVEFKSLEDAEYAIRILSMVKLFGKPIRVNKSVADKSVLEVGANLFIGNLAEEVDEKLLHDTFGAFGVIIDAPKVMRDPASGNSRGFGFISYDCFEASDAAIEAMNGQFLCNRPISVTYAFKKESKGERHGTPAERLLAAQQRAKATQNRPNLFFASGPNQPHQGSGPAMTAPPSAYSSYPSYPQGPIMGQSGFAAGGYAMQGGDWGGAGQGGWGLPPPPYPSSMPLPPHGMPPGDWGASSYPPPQGMPMPPGFPMQPPSAYPPGWS